MPSLLTRRFGVHIAETPSPVFFVSTGAFSLRATSRKG